MTETQIIDLVQQARGGRQWAVIEGLQALKHALRFQAEELRIFSSDPAYLQREIVKLDSLNQPRTLPIEAVTAATFARLSPTPHRTKVLALAKRRNWSEDDISANKPIIFLEDPRDLANIGAVIRVAAAADAAAVFAQTTIDIWHPTIIRTSAGLHFALPVFNVAELDQLPAKRPLFGLEPGGEPITDATPSNAILLFGTERSGLSQQLKQQTVLNLGLPMAEGVSSLNLATSVAASLYRIKRLW